ALSTLATALVLKLAFGPFGVHQLSYSQRWMLSIFVMATVQYLTNSSLAAFRETLKRNESFADVWQKHYLWTSITYYAGACTAAIITKLVTEIGSSAFLIALPIIAIIFATYRTYRRNIQ